MDVIAFHFHAAGMCAEPVTLVAMLHHVEAEQDDPLCAQMVGQPNSGKA